MKIGNKTYDALKFIAQIALPAAGTLYAALAALWGLPAAEQVGGTVLAVDTFLGVLLGISSASYQKNGGQFDGRFEWQPDEENGVLNLKLVDINPDALHSGKDTLTFQVQKP